MPGWLVVLAVAVVAVNLRPGATSVGPVLAEVQQGLGLSPTMAGVLTALPGLTFAAAGACAVALSRRTGISGAVTAGLVLVAAGLLARSVTGSVPVFLLLSVLGFAGMAVGNILVPAFIKRHGGRRTAALNSLYTTGLAVGATLPLLAAGPLAASGPDGWRAALGLWGLVALAAVVPWDLVPVRDRREPATTPGRARHPGRGTSILRSRTAVALCVYFGIQSMHAYVQFGWVAQIYRDGGLGHAQARLMAAHLAPMGVPGGMELPLHLARSPHLGRWIVGLGGCMVAGYLGLLLMGGFGFATVPGLQMRIMRYAEHAPTLASRQFTGNRRCVCRGVTGSENAGALSPTPNAACAPPPETSAAFSRSIGAGGRSGVAAHKPLAR